MAPTFAFVIASVKTDRRKNKETIQQYIWGHFGVVFVKLQHFHRFT